MNSWRIRLEEQFAPGLLLLVLFSVLDTSVSPFCGRCRSRAMGMPAAVTARTPYVVVFCVLNAVEHLTPQAEHGRYDLVLAIV